MGIVVFIRPLAGSLVSVLLARANASRGNSSSSGKGGTGGGRWYHSPRKMAQIGAVGGPPAYLIYYFMYWCVAKHETENGPTIRTVFEQNRKLLINEDPLC